MEQTLKWLTIDEINKYNGMFLLFSPYLIDEDFNPEGVVEGYFQDIDLRGTLKDSVTKTEAAMNFFDISLNQVQRIFIPEFSYDISKIKPIEVANVIKLVIQERKDDYNRYNDFTNS